MIIEYDTKKLIEKILTWTLIFLVCVVWIFHFTRGTEHLKNTAAQVIELPSGWHLYKKHLVDSFETKGIMSLHEVPNSFYIQANPTGTAYLAESKNGEALAFIFAGDNGKAINHTMRVRALCNAFQTRKVKDVNMEISTTSCTYDFVKEETAMSQKVYTENGFGFEESLSYSFFAFIFLFMSKKYVIRSKWDGS